MTFDYSKLICPRPFEMMAIGSLGEVYVCCPPLLPVCVGNLLEGPVTDVWNSDKAQTVRKSILDGSYGHCVLKNCGPMQGSGGLLERSEISNPVLQDAATHSKTRLDHQPRELLLCHDHVCNLTCPFCRDGYYTYRGDDHERVSKIHDIIMGELLDHARVVTMAGMGDPFAGKFYLSFLRDFDQHRWPDLRINLITNGLLLTERMWKSVKNSHGAIDTVAVSVNAGTRETFEINQRGGSFQALLNALDLLDVLRKGREIEAFQMNFFVQENNYRELPDFVRLAKEHSVDVVFVQHVLTSPTYDDHILSKVAVHEPEHPEHLEFLDVLRHPVLADPMVSLSNLSYLVPSRRESARAREQKAWQLA